jgi:putative membrane protein
MRKPWMIVLTLGTSAALAFACEKQGTERQATNVQVAQEPLTASGGQAAMPVAPLVDAPTKSDTLPQNVPAASGLALDDLPSPGASAAPLPSKGAGGNATTGPVGATSLGDDAPGTGITKLTPGQVLHFADTANAGEIEQARHALSKARDPQVRSFASLMIEEHTAAKEAGRALGQKLGVVLAGNPLSADLTKHASALVKPVESTSGQGFDRAYMQEQVDLHEYVLKTLDEDVTPQAKLPELKAYLSDLRAHVAHHLEVARSTLQRVGGGPTATE